VSEDSGFGKFLTALFGYNGDPSALEVAVWFTFLATALVLFVRPLLSWRRTPAPAQA
jgi:high-affinity Fe2+/Pb2+ permease